MLKLMIGTVMRLLIIVDCYPYSSILNTRIITNLMLLINYLYTLIEMMLIKIIKASIFTIFSNITQHNNTSYPILYYHRQKIYQCLLQGCLCQYYLAITIMIQWIAYIIGINIIRFNAFSFSLHLILILLASSSDTYYILIINDNPTMLIDRLLGIPIFLIFQH